MIAQVRGLVFVASRKRTFASSWILMYRFSFSKAEIDQNAAPFTEIVQEIAKVKTLYKVLYLGFISRWMIPFE